MPERTVQSDVELCLAGVTSTAYEVRRTYSSIRHTGVQQDPLDAVPWEDLTQGDQQELIDVARRLRRVGVRQMLLRPDGDPCGCWEIFVRTLDLMVRQIDWPDAQALQSQALN